VVGREYPFKTQPFEHQLQALACSWDKESFAYFMEMGTGKSKVILDNIALLWDAGKIDGALIIAPKGVYMNWYNKEIPEHLPDHVAKQSRIAYWRSGPSEKEKALMERLFTPNDDLNIFLMNVEALSTPRGVRVAERFLLGHKAMIAVDESTTIKSPKAERSKSIVKLGAHAEYRRIATGSPVTKNPLDLFQQCAFLDWKLLGFSSFYSFRSRYAVTKEQITGGRKFIQVVAFRNTEELATRVKKFSFRKTKDECLDLPDKIYTKRDVELTDEQRKAYNEMRTNAITSLGSGVATVTVVITQLLRLHQIVCGYINTDDGYEVPLKSRRLEALMETLEECEGKVIIWANYRFNLKEIHRRISDEYGPDSVVTYYGDTTDKERDRAKVDFQNPDSPVRFFVGNTQTGGYGITLTEASTVIYYSNNYDLEKRLQSEDRAHRFGQTKNVLYIDLVTPDTVDEKILEALRTKNDIARLITGDQWKSWI